MSAQQHYATPREDWPTRLEAAAEPPSTVDALDPAAVAAVVALQATADGGLR